MKRLFDITASSFALLLLGIPLLLLVVLVRTKLGSPVFFGKGAPA